MDREVQETFMETPLEEIVIVKVDDSDDEVGETPEETEERLFGSN